MLTVSQQLAILDARDGLSQPMAAPAFILSDVDLARVLNDHGFASDLETLTTVRAHLSPLAARPVDLSTSTWAQRYEVWATKHREKLSIRISLGTSLLFWFSTHPMGHMFSSLVAAATMGVCMHRISRWAFTAPSEPGKLGQETTPVPT